MGIRCQQPDHAGRFEHHAPRPPVTLALIRSRPAARPDANYTISFVAGTLTVTPAALTITADDKSKVYGAALPALTASYSGFVNGDTCQQLDTAGRLSTSATASSHVGTYPITASAAARCQLHHQLCRGHTDRDTGSVDDHRR